MTELLAPSKPDSRHLYTVLGSFQGKKHFPGIVVDADAFIKCVQVNDAGKIKVGIVYDYSKKVFISHLLGEIPVTSAQASEEAPELEQVSLDDLADKSEPSYVPEDPEFVDAQEPLGDISREVEDSTPIDSGEPAPTPPATDVIEPVAEPPIPVDAQEPLKRPSSQDEAVVLEMSKQYPNMLLSDSENKLYIPERFFDEIHVYGEFKHLYSNLYRLQPICCEGAFLVFNSKENLLICSSCSAKYPNTIPVKPKPSITF